ncbi:hypothetical protein DNI29_11530 [Hymenobacter sediminis]|uniref:hypothetical protein n=1 Tax=Hymenobacter sediminis TaxID=2218621 RepID=UPI000F4F3F82|nr:hypothetical protein [Hymenobacter sediminis]RPD46789.1 hypothetical protein DNI29_11530 [Hymenobacter sediminis]
MRHPLTETFKLLGFDGPSDLVASAYGLKALPLFVLKIQVSGTLLAAIVAFSTKWIWKPPLAMVLLIGLDILNAWYGYQADVKLRGAGFKWDELQRTFGKIVGTLLVLTLIKNLINSYEYYAYAADVVFAWLFTYKGRKLAAKMVALKVVEGGLPKLIAGLVASKFGPYIVDYIQKKPVEVPTPGPAVEPAPTPEGAQTPEAA